MQCNLVLFFPTEDVLERIMDHRLVLKRIYFYRSIHVMVISRGVMHAADVQTRAQSLWIKARRCHGKVEGK